jgi:hypothetical protein
MLNLHLEHSSGLDTHTSRDMISGDCVMSLWRILKPAVCQDLVTETTSQQQGLSCILLKKSNTLRLPKLQLCRDSHLETTVSEHSCSLLWHWPQYHGVQCPCITAGNESPFRSVQCARTSIAAIKDPHEIKNSKGHVLAVEKTIRRQLPISL